MFITTTSGHTYSYLHRTNEIVGGIEEVKYEWEFAPLAFFSSMPMVEMVVIGITEQCNLRCKYCCYSGAYPNNRKHGIKGLTNADIDEIYDFALRTVTKRPLHIAFYGGEPLLQYPLIQYTVNTGRTLLGDDVVFSIATNGTLLTSPMIDWLIDHGVEMLISIDGPKLFHDKYRVCADGKGSFDKVHDALAYITEQHPQHRHRVNLQMTMSSYREIEQIASEWHNDSLLREWEPFLIHGLTENPSQELKKVHYETQRFFFEHLMDVYEEHQEWAVLKVFFNECIVDWKNRPIMDVDGMVPMSTCAPMNTRLFIDANKEIGVCEKMADKYRIGDIRDGIDWDKANAIVKNFYDRRVNRCKSCPAIRVCGMCLKSMEYDDVQWDVLCHNEREYARLYLWMFCEMAERRMVS